MNLGAHGGGVRARPHRGRGGHRRGGARARATAGWSRFRPRRSTGSARTRPTARPSRGSMPRRAGRVQSADRACRRSRPRRCALATLLARRREKLAGAFWPGPLTLVLPNAETAARCRSWRPRARQHRACACRRIRSRAICSKVRQAGRRAVGQPVGPCLARQPPSTCSPISTAASISSSMAARAMSASSRPSSLVSTSARLCCVRGASPREQIERVLGAKVVVIYGRAEGGPLAPGMLHSHYAPRAALRLEATALEPGEAGLDFGGRFAPGENVLDLSARGDTVEAAANLYSYLRRLDASGAQTIAVAPMPARGLGEAIRDRLKRAAAPTG